MEKSTLYDLLSVAVLHKWRDDEEKEDCYFTQKEIEVVETNNSPISPPTFPIHISHQRLTCLFL